MNTIYTHARARTHTRIKQSISLTAFRGVISPPWPVILAPRCRPVPRQGRYIDRGRWSICYLFIRIEIFLPTCVVVMFDHVIKHWINCLVHHSLENKFSVSKIHHGEKEVCVQSFSGLHLFLSSAVTCDLQNLKLLQADFITTVWT